MQSDPSDNVAICNNCVHLVIISACNFDNWPRASCVRVIYRRFFAARSIDPLSKVRTAYYQRASHWRRVIREKRSGKKKAKRRRSLSTGQQQICQSEALIIQVQAPAGDRTLQAHTANYLTDAATCSTLYACKQMRCFELVAVPCIFHSALFRSSAIIIGLVFDCQQTLSLSLYILIWLENTLTEQ